MARFDVYAYKGAGGVAYVIDLQTNLLATLKTRVVVPLVPLVKAKKEVLPHLKPVLPILGKPYVMMTTEIGTLTIDHLGDVVANLESDRLVIITAMGFLLQGF